MIQPATLKFHADLAQNNTREWLEANRKAYEAAKDNFEETVESLLKKLVPVEPALEGQKAKDCIFRIHRDIRCSKDKTPYKTHFGALFSKGGKNHEGAGYYLHVEPGKSFAGGGMWMPMPPQLKALRQEIDYNFKEFQAIIDDKKFKKLFGAIEGEKLVRPPKDYDAENPAIEYLKMKSFTAGHHVTDKDLTSKAFEDKIVDVFGAMKDFIGFLNRAVS